MQRLTFILFALTVSVSAYSQKAENAIGLRGGWGTGVTFQHYVSEKHAVEFIAHTRWRGMVVTGLYEVHEPFFDVDGVQWYYGVGAHIGVWRYYKNGPKWFEDEWTGSRTVIGADAIIGLEYFFDEIPFQISADWKPAINLIGYSGLWGDDGALSIRYVF